VHNIKDINVEQQSDNVDDVKVAVMRLDTPKEIFDLWYELSYMRVILSTLLKENPDLIKNWGKDTVESCRKIAQDLVKERFPKANLEYPK
jgi:hypothetical protein